MIFPDIPHNNSFMRNYISTNTVFVNQSTIVDFLKGDVGIESSNFL